MKTTIIILSVLLLLVGCNGGMRAEVLRREREHMIAVTLAEVERINENSHLGLKLLQEGTDRTYISDLAPGYDETGEYLSWGVFAKYPKDVEGVSIVSINLQSEESHIFGIKLGDDLTKAKAILAEKGYIEYELKDEIKEAYSKEGSIVMFSKYDIAIHMVFDSGNTILRLFVSLDDSLGPKGDENIVI